MLSSTTMTLIGAAVTLIAIAARIFFWRQGRNKEKLKNAERTLEDIEDANNAIIRAKSDDALSDRLRERYDL